MTPGSSLLFAFVLRRRFRIAFLLKVCSTFFGLVLGLVTVCVAVGVGVIVGVIV
jgi:hypothetical protein